MAFDATDNRINMDIYPPVNIQKECGKPSMNVDNSPKKKKHIGFNHIFLCVYGSSNPISDDQILVKIP